MDWPGLNDFDEFLIKACQIRKRKLQQPDSVGDAKTFINNLLRAEDWGNFSLRCEEAQALYDSFGKLRHRVSTTKKTTQVAVAMSSPANTLERSKAKQRAASVGLAKFKLSQGDIARAKEIADMWGWFIFGQF